MAKIKEHAGVDPKEQPHPAMLVTASLALSPLENISSPMRAVSCCVHSAFRLPCVLLLLLLALGGVAADCANITLRADTGWQMLSFNCVGGLSNSFDILATAPWKIDDTIMTRDPFLKFATFNGERFVGGLVYHDQVSPARGYKIYSGAVDAVLHQKGAPATVECVVLSIGWNWVGHAPLVSYDINSGIAAVVGSGASFTTDDQIKTIRSGSVYLATYDGSMFQGGLSELKPGTGYEVKVAQAVTFRYVAQQPLSQPPSPPSTPPLALPSAGSNPGCTPHYEANETTQGKYEVVATWEPIQVTFEGVAIGFLNNSNVNSTTTCDQMAAIGVNEVTMEEEIRGVSSLTPGGYALGWLGVTGEAIEFRYWNGAEQKEYFVP